MCLRLVLLWRSIPTHRLVLIAVIALPLLTACGGDNSSSYVVSAAVSGLQAGKSLVLLNNGRNDTVVSANGTIVLSKPIPSGSPFSVTVATQPAGETCGASPGTHASGFGNANVTVTIVCVPNTYTIGGMVSGLMDSGGGVVLQNNHGTPMTINSNGAFTFALPAASGGTYAVTVLTPPNGESCTVANGNGTIGAANVTNVSVGCAPLPFRLTVSVFGISNTAGLVLQNNGGDDLPIPSSTVYVFKTLVSSGSPYNVTVSAQPPGHTCFVISGSGTVTADTVVTVVCPWHVAYMSGAPNTNALYGYYIDEQLGMLIPFGIGPFASGNSPGFIVISPDGRFAYVITGDNTVWVYTIDATTGALNHIATNPVSLGASPITIDTRDSQITLNPAGSAAYVIEPVVNIGPSSNSVYGFDINPASGDFTPMTGSPFATGTEPTAITLNPEGTFAYVAAVGPQQVDAYTVNGATGALTPIAGSPFSGGLASFDSLFVDPTRRFLYEGGWINSNTISAFSIDPGSGALSPVEGSPFAAGNLINEACFAPSGGFLYAIDIELMSVNIGVKTVYAYPINTSTGAVGQPASYQFPLGTSPSIGACTVDPSGKFLYFVGDSGFSINGTTGALSQIFPSWPSFAAGARFMAITSLN